MTGRVVVQKYGGSSLADAGCIRHVAERVAAGHGPAQPLVVVVSAMGETTDGLIGLARQISRRPAARELDLLLSTGEIVSCTLLAMALRELGVPARSYSGAQAGIHTDHAHGRARIVHLDPTRLHRSVARGEVAIVAGFQGITPDTDISTLGRGGSDTTAVALAVSLQAARCEIFTDVSGIYTADPRLVPEARQLDLIGYEEMLELASQGSRVMHPRAVEIGLLHAVPIRVASSFSAGPGTRIEGAGEMEVGNKVRAISHDTNVAKITVEGVPDRPGIAALIFDRLGQANLTADTIVQNASVDRCETDLSFTVASDDLEKALDAIRPAVEEIGARGILTDPHLGKVSIVGTGVLSAPGYAPRMFRALFDAAINIELITTSEIRITCIIAEDRVPDAVRALHSAFELDRG